MKSLASEFGDVHFAVVHIDRGGEVLAQFEASSVPGYILYRDGEEVDRLLTIPGWVETRLRRMLESAREG
jgi:thioredoxin-like negative regulator of GroEL